MEEITIERVGQPDLAFTGELIGQSGGSKPRIKIYRTKVGKFIVESGVDSQRAQALPFDNPAGLVTWLKNIEGGSITQEAQAAVEDAARKDTAFKAYWTERIE